ncbi:MAG: RMD1 family protein [Phormidesmis sp.]
MPAANELALPTAQTPIPSISLDWTNKEFISVRASILGERLILKGIKKDIEPIATNPLTIKVGETGCAVLLRYGVIVTFDLSSEEESKLLKTLDSHIRDRFETTVSEELSIAFRTQSSEQAVGQSRNHPQERPKERLENNVLWLHQCSAERLQIVAEALAKSVVLDYYEGEVSRLFERIKPFTTAIQGTNLRPPKEKELLSYLGGTLLIQQKMLGIVEVGEKPDPVWDYPELDRLYLRLEDEYELKERLVALEQKLALISRTVETALGILQRDSSHRVEWYITILIVIEIGIALYDIVTR